MQSSRSFPRDPRTFRLSEKRFANLLRDLSRVSMDLWGLSVNVYRSIRSFRNGGFISARFILGFFNFQRGSGGESEFPPVMMVHEYSGIG